jgi:hypothetical protein
MVGRTKAIAMAPLILAGLLAVIGCGGAGGSAAAGGSGGSPAAGAGGGGQASDGSGGAAAAGSGSGSAAGLGPSSCTGGLNGSEAGVILIVCNGTARLHVTAGSLTKEFTGGECKQAGDVWSATDGVITQYGTYKGPPVDSVSVNKNSSGGGTIQLSLGGKVYFVDGGSFSLSDGGKAAHLHGKTTALSDLPHTPVTVDVSC